MGTYMLRSCAHVQVVLFLNHAPTCADGCWCPVPDLQQLELVVFLNFFPATSTNTLPAPVVVTLCSLRWLFLVALAHILHAHIATCTVVVYNIIKLYIMHVLAGANFIAIMYRLNPASSCVTGYCYYNDCEVVIHVEWHWLTYI